MGPGLQQERDHSARNRQRRVERFLNGQLDDGLG
jgi:hypothetical protein